MGWMSYESRSGMVWRRAHRRLGDLLTWLGTTVKQPVLVTLHGEAVPDGEGHVERLTRDGAASPVFTSAAWAAVDVEPPPRIPAWVLDAAPGAGDETGEPGLRWVGRLPATATPASGGTRGRPFAALVERLPRALREADPDRMLGAGLPLRARRFLHDFECIAELAELRGRDLQEVPNFGARSRDAIADALAELLAGEAQPSGRAPGPLAPPPPVLAHVDVAALGLARHPLRRLRRGGAETFGDLAGLEALPADIRTAASALIASLDPAETDPAPLLERLFEGGLVADLEGRLQQLDDRDRDILQRRTFARTPLTLAALAEVHGVSRERIRQIERACLHERLRCRALGPVLDAHLEQLRRGRTEPLTLCDLEAHAAWAHGLGAAPHVLRAYLAAGDACHTTAPLEGACVSSEAEAPWLVLPDATPPLSDLVLQILAEPEPSVDGAVLGRRAEAVAEAHGMPECAAWLASRAREELRRGHAAIPAHLPVVEALREAGAPLTLRELRRRIPGGRDLGMARLRGHVAAAGMLLAGPSTYVHPDACAPWLDREATIREVALELMRPNPTRSWRAWEIVEWLAAGDAGWASALPTWVVDHALSRRPETFERLKRWRWCLVDAPPEARRDLREVTKDVLREAGEPLPKRAFLRAVERAHPVRGPVPLRWPVACVGRGVVGLLDRDLGFTEASYRKLCEAARRRAAEHPLGTPDLERLLEQAPDGVRPLGPGFLGRLLVDHGVLANEAVASDARRMR